MDVYLLIIKLCYFREDDDGMEEISSMPGIYRFGINRLLTHLDELVKKQLKSILVFGVITSLPKVR